MPSALRRLWLTGTIAIMIGGGIVPLSRACAPGDPSCVAGNESISGGFSGNTLWAAVRYSRRDHRGPGGSSLRRDHSPPPRVAKRPPIVGDLVGCDSYQPTPGVIGYTRPPRAWNLAAGYCVNADDSAADTALIARPSSDRSAIDGKTLAELAASELKVPDTALVRNPAGPSTVNLSTWIWLDPAIFRPLSVTASLPAAGLSSTVMARPESLRLAPGTVAAEVYPISGECRVVGGGIGRPYRKGDRGNPPCGVLYRRPAGSRPYQLTATVRWRVEWVGHGLLEPGYVETVIPIPVQEIQTIVTSAS